MTDVLNPERGLWVVEYGGSPRSGKGTINEALAKMYPASATDETGLDYRAVTWGMLEVGLIDPDMSPEDVQEKVATYSVEKLADYAARRHEIIDENGTQAMYAPEINDVVPLLGEMPVVRGAVKKGFVRRVKQKVENPEIGVLFVDGRSLAPLIREAGAKILLRTYVSCSNDAAASRELARHKAELAKKGVIMAPAQEEEFRQEAFISISSRRKRDEEREIDPAIADTDALQYWHNGPVLAATAASYSRRYHIPLSEARAIIQEGNQYFKGGRVGAGAKAFTENRQIVFDTNPVGKDEMILRAHTMVEEAFDAASKAI